MARTYCYLCFVLLIVFLLSLDFTEADFPPEGYKERCLAVLEINLGGGLYTYHPDKTMRRGMPRMIRLKNIKTWPNTFDGPFDNKFEILKYQRALKITHTEFRFPFNSIHFCLLDTGGQEYWRIVFNRIGAALRGFLYITDMIINVECLPGQRGGLANVQNYELPLYNFKTTYSCVSWLRQMERESGVRSRATAVEIVMEVQKCRVYYSDKLTDTGGRNYYCMLKKTRPNTEFPGFYRGCKINIEHNLFAALWELDYDRTFDSMPYLRPRRAYMNDLPSVEVRLRPGFKPNKYVGRLFNDRLEFLQDGLVVGLFFEWPGGHICIGPDYGQHATKYTILGEATIHRNDSGLGCVSFFRTSNYDDSSFQGIVTVTLDGYHTPQSCVDHFDKEFPHGQFKIVMATLDVGPCVGFGGGIDYASVTRSYSLDTYSCFSTEYYVTIDISSDCQYFVAGGKYGGTYQPDRSYTNNYSQFPTFARVKDSYNSPDAVLKWEDGYKLMGLTEECSTSLTSATICQNEGSLVVFTYINGDSGSIKYLGSS